jgi:hypothetical protein
MQRRGEMSSSECSGRAASPGVAGELAPELFRAYSLLLNLYHSSWPVMACRQAEL